MRNTNLQAQKRIYLGIPAVAGTEKRVLCIAYDEVVLRTRQFLLEQAGFKVTVASRLAQALVLCEDNPTFDLIVMGHQMPREDKLALIAALRPNHRVPVLSIRKDSDPPFWEADFSVNILDGPEALISAVRSAVAAKSN